MAKADLGAIPIIGAVMRQLQTFFVHRSNKTGNKSGNHASGRHAVSDQIRARVGDARFPPILIFPQGTTTSGSVLTKFAAGAFLAGVPVQPVVVHYPFCCLDPAWVPGPSTGWLLLRMLCQFHNFLTVTYLPVYEPSEAEVKDPHLFADNVRRVMADRLGAAVTDHSYNDVYMMMKMGTYAIDRITRHQLFEGGGGGGGDGGGSAAGSAGSAGSVGGTGGTGGMRRAEGVPQGDVAPGVTAVGTGRRQCEPILADSMMHLSGTNVNQALGLLELFRKADVDSTARVTQGHFCRVWTAHRDDYVGPDTPPLPPSSNVVLQHLFRIFDRHSGSSSGGGSSSSGGGGGGGGLTLRGVCVGWSKLRDTDLTFEQQCKLVFVTYDLDDDGRVAASDIHDVTAFVRAHHSSATGREGGTAGAVVGGGGVGDRRVLCSTASLVDDIANAFARFGATGAAVASSGRSRGGGEQGGAFETGEGEGTAGAAEEKGEAKGGNDGEGGSGGDGGGDTMVHPPGLLSLEGFQAVCREHPEYLDALLRNLRCLGTFVRDTLVDSRRRS